MTTATSSLSSFPLVGRASELQALHALLDNAEAGRGRMMLLVGDTGVGKTRLSKAVADEAARRGWSVVTGRAYPVETGVPYAPFSDAMLPLLSRLTPEALTVLTRGGDAELAYLFPALRPASPQTGLAATDSSELKTRLLWNFTQLLSRLAAKQPLLILLEDLHWADASSLELLHFIARQISGDRIALLCTYNLAYREQNPTLRATEQSLISLRAIEVVHLEPLAHRDVEELIGQLFSVDEAVTREFTALLYGWTRGNPFFLEETLKSLVHAGRLYRQEGSWLGWEVEELHLPRSVRDAVLRRFERLTPEARAVADLHAVLGTSASYELLRSVSPLAEPALVTALDELRREHILVERLEGDHVLYDFRHPLLRETLYGELGLARARLLHGTLAQALEAHYAARTEEHVDELAFHFARAGARHLAGKTVQYLSAAGRRALARYAYREAANYLGAALDRADEALSAADEDVDSRLVEELARARQRLGEYDAAIALWERARAEAEEQGDVARLAAVHFRLGLAYDWSERNQEALTHYEAGLAAAAEAGDPLIQARLKLKKAECLQELGRPAEAQREIESALEIAEGLDDTGLLANVHRALLLLHTWMGPPEVAREHGRKALALAEEIGDRSLACALHWGLAVLAGLTGAGEATAWHIAECERLVEELRLPLHRLWIGEVAIEYASATGDWDAGIALGERYIALARAFNQRSLLPRLLVWTALIYLGRGDLERGKRYVDEAWDLSGAGRDDDQLLDVHTAIPAHTGLAGYHLAAGEFEKAIQVGEAGLAIADRSGYALWSIHRLLPIIAEAALWLRDLDRAQQLRDRVRRDSERLGHRLGLAWVDACDALVVWLRGEPERAISLLRRAAEQLESVPIVSDAARVRRQLAGRLADVGDREGALQELRYVHEVFVRIGAERELSKTRDQFRELGARPPARETTTGAAGLTAREVEIVRLVAEHKSNKAIGQALEISSRTVSTHLSNIFRKLNVSSRAELTELARKTVWSEV